MPEHNTVARGVWWKAWNQGQQDIVSERENQWRRYTSPDIVSHIGKPTQKIGKK
jgi:hypothetical protein